ncbi:hypothetical protein AeRB84_014843 [Aphanomyces euteiches]|nr:hypothetical protein AeRB84_014843 [Aphanomyces euteiches]
MEAPPSPRHPPPGAIYGQRTFRSPKLQKAPPPQVDSALLWTTFFHAICPAVPTAHPLRLHMPDTVLLNPTASASFLSSSTRSHSLCRAPSIWYHTSTGTMVKRKESTHVTPNAILASFLGPHADRIKANEAVAVVRFGFSSRLMSRADFTDLCSQMQANKVEPLTPSAGLPFCIQRYIKPLDDKRYIVSFSFHTPHEQRDDAKPTSMCEAFVSQYSKRYNTTKIDPSSHDDSDEKQEDIPVLFGGNRRVSFEFQTALGTQDVKVVSPTSRMKHLTIKIVHHINSRHAVSQIQGIVCEFIIGDDDDQIYLTAILGLAWQNGQEPTWERLAHVDPESHMIREFYKSRTRSSPRRPPRSPPSLPAETPPSTQTPRFPSVPNAQVSPVDVCTRSLDLADRSPRYKNASPSKFFRDGRFVTKLSALQCESACRLHMPMHRTCRSALLVDLARQVEDFKDELVQQKEKCILAEEHATTCLEDTKAATIHMHATDERLRALERHHDAQREAWEGRFMACEERDNHMNELLQRQNEHIERLHLRKAKEELDMEQKLADFDAQVADMKRQDEDKIRQLHDKDATIAALMEEREKARAQAIVDTIQREGSQTHIHTLRAQIAILKREKEVLRKEANRYMAERDDLLRVLPVVTSISDKKSAKQPPRVNVADLFDPGDNAKEINMLQLMLASHGKTLKGIYQLLTLQAATGTAKTSALPFPAFFAFAADCGFVAAISMHTIESIVFKVAKEDGRKTSLRSPFDEKPTSLSFSHFCECLIRIAHVLYKTELPQLTKRFACLIENDLAVFEKNRKGSKDDEESPPTPLGSAPSLGRSDYAFLSKR